jgi:RNA polymerase sigma-70 factor (ECF subfamily)
MAVMESGSPTDAECIRASHIDADAFGPVFERHAAGVHRYLVRRVQRAAVDDLLAETFLVAFRSRARYDHSYPDARPWLFGIATNLARRHIRSEARRLRMIGRAATEPSSVAVDAHDVTLSRLEADDRFRALEVALSKLDEKYLDVLMLIAGPRLEYEEIARALGLPVGTVRSRISRGRARLRELLATGGQYPRTGPDPAPSIIKEYWQ